MIVGHVLAYELSILNGEIKFRSFRRLGASDHYYSGPAGLVANEWQHVAVSVDSAARQIRFYRNGTLLKTVSNTGSPYPRNEALWIASDGRTASSKFAGGIDDVRLFDTALTESGIQSVFADGTPAPSPVDAWRRQIWGDPDHPDAGSGRNPDRDSLDNLLEFTFGTDPLNPDVIGGRMRFHGDTLTLRWRRPEVAGLAYEIQESTDLGPDSWGAAAGVVISTISTDGDFETVEVTKPGGWAAGGDPRTFLRLKVTE